MGTGPVDAAYKAIDALTSVKVHLETYSMESERGIEAMATTKVVVNPVDSATSLHSSGYTTSEFPVRVQIPSWSAWLARTWQQSTSSSAGTCGGRRRNEVEAQERVSGLPGFCSCLDGVLGRTPRVSIKRRARVPRFSCQPHPRLSRTARHPQRRDSLTDT